MTNKISLNSIKGVIRNIVLRAKRIRRTYLVTATQGNRPQYELWFYDFGEQKRQGNKKKYKQVRCLSQKNNMDGKLSSL